MFRIKQIGNTTQAHAGEVLPIDQPNCIYLFFKEDALHSAIVAAMNEMFSQQTAKGVLQESVATVLASAQPEMTLPAVKSKIVALEARYKELLNLVMADSAKYEGFEDEFRTTNEEMARLKSLQTKLELEQPSVTDLDRRMEQITSTIDQMDASITEYDDIRTRQLISTIKVMDKETLLIRFKDGTEITQQIEQYNNKRIYIGTTK